MQKSKVYFLLRLRAPAFFLHCSQPQCNCCPLWATSSNCYAALLSLLTFQLPSITTLRSRPTRLLLWTACRQEVSSSRRSEVLNYSLLVAPVWSHSIAVMGVSKCRKSQRTWTIKIDLIITFIISVQTSKTTCTHTHTHSLDVDPVQFWWILRSYFRQESGSESLWEPSDPLLPALVMWPNQPQRRRSTSNCGLFRTTTRLFSAFHPQRFFCKFFAAARCCQRGRQPPCLLWCLMVGKLDNSEGCWSHIQMQQNIDACLQGILWSTQTKFSRWRFNWAIIRLFFTVTIVAGRTPSVKL